MHNLNYLLKSLRILGTRFLNKKTGFLSNDELTQNEHYFFIDIYADLQRWIKPLMKVLLHIAAAITLFEDLPYLRALSERNIENLFYSHKSSNHH